MIKKATLMALSLPMLACYAVFVATFMNGKSLDINVAYFLEESARSGRSGGIGPMIASTLLLSFLSSFIVLPTSLCVSLFLHTSLRQKKALFYLSDTLLSILMGIPSIVFGLFGNAFFVVYLGLGYSLLSGTLTLVCMTLPTCSKLMLDHLKIIPREYFLSAESLNVSYPKSLLNIYLPLSWPAISSSFIFALGRAMSETAALFFTSGYVDRMPRSLMDSGRSLSVHIYDLALNIPGGDRAASKASFAFLLIIVFVNLFSKLFFRSEERRGL